jgi:hypothetical protein
MNHAQKNHGYLQYQSSWTIVFHQNGVPEAADPLHFDANVEEPSKESSANGIAGLPVATAPKFVYLRAVKQVISYITEIHAK